MEPTISDPIPVVANATGEDNSWALPRPKANRRQKVLAAFLAAACVSLTSFTVGVSVGKKRGPDAVGSGGLGRNAGTGGFGGGGGAATPGGGAATASTVSPTTTVDPNLGGLLPGLEAPLDTAAVVASIPPTTAAPPTS